MEKDSINVTIVNDFDVNEDDNKEIAATSLEKKL